MIKKIKLIAALILIGSVKLTAQLDCSGFTIQDQSVTSSATGSCPDPMVGATITLGSSQLGVDYVLRNSTDNSVLDGPIAGNGSALMFSSGSFSQTTTLN
ncbi:MAG: hypothetical protein AAFY41_11675, partial [Bacteroidota bacterium]